MLESAKKLPRFLLLLAAGVMLPSLTASLAAAADAKAGNTWSGYVLNGADFSAVSAQWKQPAVTCPAKGARVSFWIGFDTGTVEQAGTIATCGAPGAPPTYAAWWEMFSKHKSGGYSFAVKPGDSIKANVTYSGSGSGSYLMSVNDLTSGKSFSQREPCAAGVTCKRGTAEWIIERPGGGKYALADYDKAKFEHLEFAGAATGGTVYTMVHSNGALSTCNAPHDEIPSGHNDGIACTWHAAE